MTDELIEIENGKQKYFAVKAVILKDKKILLLKLDPKYLFLGGLWEVPGGRKKAGESDKDTLDREVWEEVALEVEIVKLLAEWKILIKEKNAWLSGKTFLCNLKTGEVKLNDPEKQHVGYKWVTISEAKKFRIPNWLRESLEKV